MAKKKATKAKKVAKKAAAKKTPESNRELIKVLKQMAVSLARIERSLQYLEDIYDEIEGIGADTEAVIRSQYMQEGDAVKQLQ
jgi:hypothetical protein